MVPPLIKQMRAELKTAMKSKDTQRLNVLRALLTDVTNAAKTSSPINTDMQMVTLLRKRAAQSKAASLEFAEANRVDLQEKEEAEIAMLNEYAGSVRMIGEGEVTKAANDVLNSMTAEGAKVDKGNLLRKLIGPGGVFDQKPVDRAMVAKVVQAVITDSHWRQMGLH